MSAKNQKDMSFPADSFKLCRFFLFVEVVLHCGDRKLEGVLLKLKIMHWNCAGISVTNFHPESLTERIQNEAVLVLNAITVFFHGFSEVGC